MRGESVAIKVKGKGTQRRRRSTRATPRQQRESAAIKVYREDPDEDEDSYRPAPDPYRCFIVALVHRAIIDLHLPADNTHGADARLWLASDAAQLWGDLLGIDMDILRKLVQADSWEIVEKVGQFWNGGHGGRKSA